MEDEIFYVIETNNNTYIDIVYDPLFYVTYPDAIETLDIMQSCKNYNYFEAKKLFELLQRHEIEKEKNYVDTEQIENDQIDEDINIKYNSKVKNIVKITITLKKEIV